MSDGERVTCGRPTGLACSSDGATTIGFRKGEEAHPRVSPSDRVLGTVELHKTLRLAIVCLLIGVSVWKFLDSVVKLNEESPWVKIALALLAMIGSGSIQSAAFWRVIVRVRRFTVDKVGRLAKLEEQADSSRTSSNLQPDGTDPPEDAA